MKTILAALLLAATAASAQAPKREVFPSDYKPQPCAADGKAVCESFSPQKLAQYGTAFQGFNIHQEWIDAHWNEMTEAFVPLCRKAANCFTVKDNDWVYCLDLLQNEFLGTCNRFPANSKDRAQCVMFAKTYYIGLGTKQKQYDETQACVAKEPQGAPRKLEAWVEPSLVELHHDGKLNIYAIDAETRIPVRATITMDGDTPMKSTEGPVTKTGYPNLWTARYKRVPNAQGHTDLAPPVMTLTATGYEPLVLTMPMPEIHTMTVAMSPAVAKLKRGTNTITVTAKDTTTGKPVWGHVMAGTVVLGETNKPIALEWPKGEKRPEIWVRSLYGWHSDVVVAEGEK
ncbi:MAG TPA: hypothetical protein VEK11_25945 [Thermoanaerobaculia bacterium]|jgi:hypothetical protein|nr:hypothetical protein [Thermoanaerobaculia bacterium]